MEKSHKKSPYFIHLISTNSIWAFVNFNNCHGLIVLLKGLKIGPFDCIQIPKTSDWLSRAPVDPTRFTIHSLHLLRCKYWSTAWAPSLNFIITNNHTEMQPFRRGPRFHDPHRAGLLCSMETIHCYTKRGRIWWCAAWWGRAMYSKRHRVGILCFHTYILYQQTLKIHYEI